MESTSRREDKIADIVKELSRPENLQSVCHMRWQGEPLPSQQAVEEIVHLCRSLIFPGFFGDAHINKYNVEYHTGICTEKLYALLVDQIMAGLCYDEDCDKAPDLEQIRPQAEYKALSFIESLPELRRILGTDVRATYLGDPAALSTEEVIYCYPAIRAITNYRIAHRLLQLQVPIIPRMIGEIAHRETGIDIHPGATIGESFTIDHGTGVVIGATAIIGRNVKLYQGVTLGAKSFDTDSDGNPVKGIPRHPIIGDNVVIYSNASILGRINIGSDAVIGGNIWVTEDVAEGEKLVQAKANNILRFKQ